MVIVSASFSLLMAFALAGLLALAIVVVIITVVVVEGSTVAEWAGGRRELLSLKTKETAHFRERFQSDYPHPIVQHYITCPPKDQNFFKKFAMQRTFLKK